MLEVMYFDEKGIERLANQSGAYDISKIESAKSQGRDTSSTLKPNIAISALLQLLIPIKADIDAEATHRRNNRSDVTITLIQTPEGRYNTVVAKLKANRRLAITLDDAWLRAGSGSMFCEVIDQFEHAVTCADGRSMAYANEIGSLVLADKSTRQFRVGLGIDKIVGSKADIISDSSHLSRRLTNPLGVKLKIFGNMTSDRYLKPYVVFWA